ncbi:MAG TPA: alpha/beta hydrolase [Acidimicrobiales bacterium]|jgi:pimeloyl-ACP methyl ester carboxylesterase|nr:alpha/beta hydrolase [Acidimicrobiales bacterium]
MVTAADGVAVANHELGGSGPAILFSHATGLHGLVWAPLASHLQDAFRCVSLDHRGHGDSGTPPGLDFDWRGLARDVLAVVDGLALGDAGAPVFGVGHSSGGTAVLLAEQARPGTFAALYCFEPILVAADPPLGRDTGNWLAAGARRRREVFGSREEARDQYAAKPPFADWSAEALEAYVGHGFEDLPDGTVRLKCRGENEALVYEMATAHDGFARLARVRCPVLLAGGETSDAFTPAARAALLERLPDARVEVVPRLGHFGPLEDPAAVAASIRRFLAA